jgi:flagellar protein FlaG
MENRVAIPPLIPDPPHAKPAVMVVEAARAPETPQSDAADLRLVIEEGPVAGSYVYKTVDRRTGEVVQQLPREEVVRMRTTESYAAGDVIQTEA